MLADAAPVLSFWHFATGVRYWLWLTLYGEAFAQQKVVGHRGHQPPWTLALQTEVLGWLENEQLILHTQIVDSLSPPLIWKWLLLVCYCRAWQLDKNKSNEGLLLRLKSILNYLLYSDWLVQKILRLQYGSVKTEKIMIKFSVVCAVCVCVFDNLIFANQKMKWQCDIHKYNNNTSHRTKILWISQFELVNETFFSCQVEYDGKEVFS